MFYTRVPLELSQLVVVVTLDCISTRKLSLFCLSNIVCYRFMCKKWVLPAPGVSDTFTEISCVPLWSDVVISHTHFDNRKGIRF